MMRDFIGALVGMVSGALFTVSILDSAGQASIPLGALVGGIVALSIIRH